MAAVHIPETSDIYQGVLMLHGFNSNKTESHRFFWKISRYLEKNNIASLRFDYRGCGESDGNSEDFTIKDHIADARTAMRKLLKVRNIDKNNITVIGFSMGSIVAAYLLPYFPCIKKIIFISGIAYPKSVFFDIPRKENPLFLPAYNAGLVDHKGQLYSKLFFDKIIKAKPLKKAAGFIGQSLLIHTDTDETVPVENLYAYQKVLQNQQTLIIPQSNHAFNNAAHEAEIIKTILNFIRHGS